MSWISDFIYKIYKIDEIDKIRLIECISLTGGGIYWYDKHIAFIKELVTLILHNAVWVVGHLYTFTTQPSIKPSLRKHLNTSPPLPPGVPPNKPRSPRSNQVLRFLNPLLESQSPEHAPRVLKLLNPLLKSQSY